MAKAKQPRQNTKAESYVVRDWLGRPVQQAGPARGTTAPARPTPGKVLGGTVPKQRLPEWVEQNVARNQPQPPTGTNDFRAQRAQQTQPSAWERSQERERRRDAVSGARSTFGGSLGDAFNISRNPIGSIFQAERSGELQRAQRTAQPPPPNVNDQAVQSNTATVRRDWLGRELDADGRVVRGRERNLQSVRELTQEEYDALSPRQQAAVQYNTGLVDASRMDGRSGGDNVQAFTSSLGLDTGNLDDFLQLNSLIDDNILQQLDNRQLQQDDASTKRWAQGHTPSLQGTFARSAARTAADRAADAIVERLATTGISGLGIGGTPLIGYGADTQDQVVQQVYQNLIDSSLVLSRSDLEAGLKQINAANGTNVTLNDVSAFAEALWGGVPDVNSARSTPGDGEVGYTGQPIQARSIAEIRRAFDL